ncbi:hypothetical protein [Aminobacter aminovorans]|uniref:hypothetical protein n=1 Tax=Aminobacter aminovorans TaxID=83263 RepID=UPI002856E9B7|nr:hypothetical protein [Aminobacter aminovorans]MDR7223652.1 hypothetical protein [Aminobacter aminovorans]
MKTSILFTAASIALLPTLAIAQDSEPQTIPFEGGNFTIVENAEGEKVLAYDGKELAKNYVAFYDRTVEVSDTKVAIFAVGDGGNACSPETVLAWKTEAGIQSTTIGAGKCDTPPAAVTAYNIFFIPYPLPGETLPVTTWDPENGLTMHGNLAYAPQPGTDWSDLDPKKFEDGIVAAFKNEAVYKAAQQLLGNDLPGFATSLLVNGGTESLPSGAFFATGCIPHACGGGNGFIAIDAKARKLYLAQQTETEPKAWPALATWPGEFRDALTKALADE